MLDEDIKNNVELLLFNIKSNPNIQFLELRNLANNLFHNNKNKYNFEFISNINKMFDTLYYVSTACSLDERPKQKDSFFQNELVYQAFFKQWQLRINPKDITSSGIWSERLLQLSPNKKWFMEINQTSHFLCQSSSIPIIKMDFFIKFLTKLITSVSSKELISFLEEFLRHLFYGFNVQHIENEGICDFIKKIFLLISERIRLNLEKKEITLPYSLLALIHSFKITKPLFLKFPELEKVYAGLNDQARNLSRELLINRYICEKNIFTQIVNSSVNLRQNSQKASECKKRI